jgi:glycosyltransferase involved in cell wall biosynthesis
VRVGIDYLPAVSHAPGVGRYTRELVRALAALDDGPELALLDVGRARRFIGEPALGIAGSKRVTLVRSNQSRRFATLLRRHADRWLGGVDVFQHATLPTLRVATARECLAVSELPPPGAPADALVRRTLARMSGVIVFCDEYKARIADRYGVPAERIHRTPVGADHWRRELDVLPPRADPPAVLVLGALRPARAHLAVLRALETLDARGVPLGLIAIGRAGPAAQEFERAVSISPARERVRWHHEVSESELPHTVGSASVMVHLAEDEGTAVTPLEAFAMGLAVVASPLPALRESLGDLATWIDRADAVRDPALLADAIGIALASGDRDARARHAERFTWRACARATAEAWRRIGETQLGT